MRTLDVAETNEVSGGTFGLLSRLFGVNCYKPAPAPYCPPAKVDKCAPAPRPKHGC